MTPKNNELLFCALGGSGEIGMNVTLYGHAGKWLMVDCGVTFADANYPGIDVILAGIRTSTSFASTIVKPLTFRILCSPPSNSCCVFGLFQPRLLRRHNFVMSEQSPWAREEATAPLDIFKFEDPSPTNTTGQSTQSQVQISHVPWFWRSINTRYGRLPNLQEICFAGIVWTEFTPLPWAVRYFLFPCPMRLRLKMWWASTSFLWFAEGTALRGVTLQAAETSLAKVDAYCQTLPDRGRSQDEEMSSEAALEI